MWHQLKRHFSLLKIIIMVSTKNYFDKMMANHNELMATFTAYTNEAVAAMTPDKELAEKGVALANELLAKPIKAAGEMAKKENVEKFQKDFWGAYTEQVAKQTELTTEMYRKSFEYMQEVWAKFSMPQQQDRLQKLNETAQKLAKTTAETAAANAKITQEFMTVKG